MRNRLALLATIALTACTAAGSAIVTPIAPLVPVQQATAETLLALNALCSAETIDPRSARPDLKLAGGMGTGGFKVDSDVKAAQDWFDYGLALSHAFYHQDAKLALRRSAELDPACSVCAWGEAWGLGPTLNYGLEDEDRKLALAAAQRAQSLAKPGDTRARQLADAMVARYQGEGTEPAFGQAMAKIAAASPADLELSVLAAHSLMIPVRAGNEDGLKPALAILEGVLKQRPDDTGAIHYYIHGTEFDDRAEDAIPYAERLGKLAPAASHLVHMPAHTFFHAGRYQEAATVNALAIEADSAWVGAGGDPRPPMSTTGLPMYYAHNLAFGLAGALMSGDGELALRYADHAAKAYPVDGEYNRFDPSARTYVALGRYAPDRMLALPPSKHDEPEFHIYRAYARGEAYLQKGDGAGARRALDGLRRIAGDDSAKTMAVAVLEGRIAMAAGDPRRAAMIFTRAADEQVGMQEYMDPPRWWYPVRRSAAAAWLKAGDFARAEAEARSSLAAWKHDPLALWVLGKAQAGQGKALEADATLSEARKLWRGNFDSITAEAV